MEGIVDAGHPDVPDIHEPDSTGISLRAENNIDGVRMSMALAYLDPNRHRLNLTVKAGVQALRIIFSGHRATGLEVESGGERFTVGYNRVWGSAAFELAATDHEADRNVTPKNQAPANDVSFAPGVVFSSAESTLGGSGTNIVGNRRLVGGRP